MSLDNFDPYLSIVVTSRNDNHGGSLLKRMQVFVDTIIEQIERYRLKTELIIVEWNPPEDKENLSQALHWPHNESKYCQVRIIQVPRQIHEKFRHAKTLPLYQMIGKNVGIIRARGEFILCSNIDILFSEQLISYFAKRKLKDNIVYRAVRFDIPIGIPTFSKTQEKLKWCKKNAFRVSNRKGTFFISRKFSIKPYLKNILSIFYPLYYLSKNLLLVAELMVRILRYLLYGIFQDGKIFEKELNKLFNKKRIFFRYWLNKKNIFSFIGNITSRFFVQLDTNACGDFTLMHRNLWNFLGGYAEFDMYSFHIDSLLIHQAFRNGFKIHTFKTNKCIYHIDHSLGSGWTPEGQDALFLRLRKKGITYLNSRGLTHWIRTMWEKPKGFKLTADEWGFNNITLPEFSPISYKNSEIAL